RLVLMFMGAIPRKLVVHSTRSERWLQLLTPGQDNRERFPLLVMPLENTVLPRGAEDKRKLRARFGLPTDKFIFVSPGFFFARKRYREVIEALPQDAVLVLSGTKSSWEPEYFDEIIALAKTKANVVINTEYETMGEYVAASDAVVLFYEDVFQSAVVTQAVWAGLPCIFSEAEGLAPYHAAGESMDGPVRVRRFAVTGLRSTTFKESERHILFEPHTLADEHGWLAMQGPHTPDLLEFLTREGKSYDAILFYTYIYEPTAAGLPLVPERAGLVSTAHDEEPLRLVPYRALFQLPRAFGFLTPEERDLVHARFRNEHIPSEVLGIGLDAPPWHDPEPFRDRYAPRGPLVLYLGQVSEGKAVDELLADWIAYRDSGGACSLVLAGTARMPIPERDDIVALRRVSDEEKYAPLEAADALVLPSPLQSLGIVLLEAWQVG